MVCCLFRLNPQEEIATLTNIKVGRALKFCFLFCFVFFSFLLVNFYSSYNLCLSTFKCYHKKGEIDETRRSNFRLFQVFLLYIQMAIDQRCDNKTILTLYFVR